MRLVLFLIFSIIEYTALFILSFSIFLFKIRENAVYIAFSAVLLSMFSYIMRDVANMSMISPFLQLVIIFLIFWLLIRVPAIYAGVMATFGYVSFGFLQTLFVLTLSWTSIIPMEKLLQNEYMLYMLSFTASMVTIIISAFLVKFRIGFSFIPDDQRISIGLKGNLQLLVIIILGAVSQAVFLFSSQHGYLQWLFLAMVVIIGLLLYFLFRKETEQ